MERPSSLHGADEVRPIRAVTGLRRFPIIAIAALLAAGCGANQVPSSTSPTDSALATANPSPSTTPTHPGPTPTAPAPSQSPSIEPNEPTCPSAPLRSDPDVFLVDSKDLFWLPMDITRLTPVADPGIELTPPPSFGREDSGFIVGGGETRFALSYGSLTWLETPHTITRLRMALQAEGHEPIRLAVQLQTGKDGSTSAFVDVPNITWRGSLSVGIEWQDPCFAYEATTVSGVIIDPRATVAGCPDRIAPAFKALDEAFEPPMHVGSIDVELSPWAHLGKVTPLPSIDASHPIYRVRADMPVVIDAPGATVVVTYANELVDLDDGDLLGFYRRGPFLRWLEAGAIYSGDPPPDVVFRSTLVGHADGTFSFVVPGEPGRYVAGLDFVYDSACSYGNAGAAFGIDVE